jgi:hypothetical protein
MGTNRNGFRHPISEDIKWFTNDDLISGGVFVAANRIIPTVKPVSKRRQRMIDHYKDKALASASWIVSPPVKNIYKQHQINRKRNLKSGSTFGRVYGTPMK